MAGKDPVPDERVVYLSLKNLFKGQNALIRKATSVRKLVVKHKAQGDIADLVREHNLDVVCNLARKLLTEEVFESTVKAKIRFPELFDPSPAQSAEKESSEAEAARNEADAIQRALQGSLTDVEAADPWQVAAKEEAEIDKIEEATEPPLATSSKERPSADPLVSKASAKAILSASTSVNVPPLFPVYLPLPTQHQLLGHLQTLLETACFDFARRKLPDLLEARGWKYAESVELNLWADVFKKRPALFPDKDFLRKPFHDLLHSIANIRHTAVHRVSVTARGILQFIVDAETMAHLLGEEAHINKICRLRRDAQSTMEELEQNKHLLRLKLDETLQGIAAGRAELDLAEREAIEAMEQEDEEYQCLAGKSIQESIAPSEDSFSTAVETEKDTLADLGEIDGAIEDDQDDGDWEQRVSDPETAYKLSVQ